MNYNIYQTGSSVLSFLGPNDINYVLIYDGDYNQVIVNELKLKYPNLMICEYSKYINSPRYMVWSPYAIKIEGNIDFYIPNILNDIGLKNHLLDSIRNYILNWNCPSKFVYQLMLGLMQIINNDSTLTNEQQQILYNTHLYFLEERYYQIFKNMFINFNGGNF